MSEWRRRPSLSSQITHLISSALLSELCRYPCHSRLLFLFGREQVPSRYLPSLRLAIVFAFGRIDSTIWYKKERIRDINGELTEKEFVK